MVKNHRVLFLFFSQTQKRFFLTKAKDGCEWPGNFTFFRDWWLAMSSDGKSFEIVRHYNF